MDRDSRDGTLEEEIGNVFCAGGGELALGGDVRVMVVAPWSTYALAPSSSALFVPDPCPGEASWGGSV